MIEVHFNIGTGRYFVRSGEGRFESRQMNTEPMLVGGQPYIPVIYLAEALNATAISESRGGELIVTITSTTGTAGDFNIPQSHTDDVYVCDSEIAKGTQFTLEQAQGRRFGSTNFQNRKELLLVIFAQQVSNGAVERIRHFIDSTNEPPRSSEQRIEELFLDNETNRYIVMVRNRAIGYIFLIYDEGFTPVDIHS
jgi:hypothetical protein